MRNLAREIVGVERDLRRRFYCRCDLARKDIPPAPLESPG